MVFRVHWCKQVLPPGLQERGQDPLGERRRDRLAGMLLGKAGSQLNTDNLKMKTAITPAGRSPLQPQILWMGFSVLASALLVGEAGAGGFRLPDQDAFATGLAIRRELGDRRGIALSLGNLAEVAMREGDLARAQDLYVDSLQIGSAIGDQRQVMHVLDKIAAMHATCRGLTAARLWGFLEAARGIGASGEGALRAARARLGDDAAFDGAWRAGSLLTQEEAIEEAQRR